jgi:hypothetical protein
MPSSLQQRIRTDRAGFLKLLPQRQVVRTEPSCFESQKVFVLSGPTGDRTSLPLDNSKRRRLDGLLDHFYHQEGATAMIGQPVDLGISKSALENRLRRYFDEVSVSIYS